MKLPYEIGNLAAQVFIKHTQAPDENVTPDAATNAADAAADEKR